MSNAVASSYIAESLNAGIAVTLSSPVYIDAAAKLFTKMLTQSWNDEDNWVEHLMALVIFIN